jgi:hypothetical protein
MPTTLTARQFSLTYAVITLASSQMERAMGGGILMLRGLCGFTVTWRSIRWGLSPPAIWLCPLVIRHRQARGWNGAGHSRHRL